MLAREAYTLAWLNYWRQLVQCRTWMLEYRCWFLLRSAMQERDLAIGGVSVRPSLRHTLVLTQN